MFYYKKREKMVRNNEQIVKKVEISFLTTYDYFYLTISKVDETHLYIGNMWLLT